jgi:hypothetical protein
MIIIRLGRYMLADYVIKPHLQGHVADHVDKGHVAEHIGKVHVADHVSKGVGTGENPGFNASTVHQQNPKYRPFWQHL